MAGTVREEAVKLRQNLDKLYEAGKQSEYDRFWDEFQTKGYRDWYSYAFAGHGWTDANFNPKYPINATGGANAMFLWADAITDTKVPINLGTTASNKLSIFQYAQKLKTIRKLICNCETISFADQFTGCTALQNLTFEGVIGRNFNVQWCPLTNGSLASIVSCMKDYAGTDSDHVYTLTVSSACYDALCEMTYADIGLPSDYGGPENLADYVDYIGWNLASA